MCSTRDDIIARGMISAALLRGAPHNAFCKLEIGALTLSEVLVYIVRLSYAYMHARGDLGPALNHLRIILLVNFSDSTSSRVLVFSIAILCTENTRFNPRRCSYFSKTFWGHAPDPLECSCFTSRRLRHCK